MIDVMFTMFWVVVAMVFYRIRCASRLLYGAVEIVAGIVTIVLGEFPPYAVLTSDTTWTMGSRAAHMLTLMAGVYLVVRGLDNIGQDLPDWLRPAWRRIFGLV